MAQAGEGRAPGAPLQPPVSELRCAANVAGHDADLAEPLRPPGYVRSEEAFRRLSLSAAGSRPGPPR